MESGDLAGCCCCCCEFYDQREADQRVWGLARSFWGGRGSPEPPLLDRLVGMDVSGELCSVPTLRKLGGSAVFHTPAKALPRGGRFCEVFQM